MRQRSPKSPALSNGPLQRCPTWSVSATCAPVQPDQGAHPTSSGSASQPAPPAGPAPGDRPSVLRQRQQQRPLRSGGSQQSCRPVAGVYLPRVASRPPCGGRTVAGSGRPSTCRSADRRGCDVTAWTSEPVRPPLHPAGTHRAAGGSSSGRGRGRAAGSAEHRAAAAAAWNRSSAYAAAQPPKVNTLPLAAAAAAADGGRLRLPPCRGVHGAPSQLGALRPP